MIYKFILAVTSIITLLHAVADDVCVQSGECQGRAALMQRTKSVSVEKIDGEASQMGCDTGCYGVLLGTGGPEYKLNIDLAGNPAGVYTLRAMAQVSNDYDGEEKMLLYSRCYSAQSIVIGRTCGGWPTKRGVWTPIEESFDTGSVAPNNIHWNVGVALRNNTRGTVRITHLQLFGPNGQQLLVDGSFGRRSHMQAYSAVDSVGPYSIGPVECPPEWCYGLVLSPGRPAMHMRVDLSGNPPGRYTYSMMAKVSEDYEGGPKNLLHSYFYKVGHGLIALDGGITDGGWPTKRGVWQLLEKTFDTGSDAPEKMEWYMGFHHTQAHTWGTVKVAQLKVVGPDGAKLMESSFRDGSLPAERFDENSKFTRNWVETIDCPAVPCYGLALGVGGPEYQLNIDLSGHPAGQYVMRAMAKVSEDYAGEAKYVLHTRFYNYANPSRPGHIIGHTFGGWPTKRGVWEPITVTYDTGSVAPKLFHWYVGFAHVPNTRGTVEVTSLSLTTPAGNELLHDGNFADGNNMQSYSKKDSVEPYSVKKIQCPEIKQNCARIRAHAQ